MILPKFSLMARSLSTGKAAIRLVSYSLSTKSVRTCVSQLRRFSGYEGRDGPHGIPIFGDHAAAKPVTWPDEAMGPLNVPDSRFALPGNVGVPMNPSKKEQKISDDDCEVPAGAAERHLTVVSQLISESDFLDCEAETDTDMADHMLRKYFEKARVELVIQDCPQVIQKDFGSLFPDMPTNGKLTVVTITQRTEHDMSGWSPDVEEERDHLLESFIDTAKEICHMLKVHNFWCDFIEPSTGQPYFGSYTNTTFYETDERYRHLGFQIEDLGCCKVIYHKKWGTKVFVGTLFTMAPKEHGVMQDLLRILE